MQTKTTFKTPISEVLTTADTSKHRSLWTNQPMTHISRVCTYLPTPLVTSAVISSIQVATHSDENTRITF